MAEEKKEKKKEQDVEQAGPMGGLGPMGGMDQETAQKIQELQLLEQNLQNLALQKQAFQLELNEALNALGEVTSTKDDVYKIIGSIMVKSSKSEVEKDLSHKEEVLGLRVKNLEKQENLLRERALKLREGIMSVLK